MNIFVDDSFFETNSDQSCEATEKKESSNGISLSTQSLNKINSQRDEIMKAGRCLTCFLFSPFCLCSAVKKIHDESPIKLRQNVKFELFMHFKEWGRASNTGKLLQIGMPEDSHISIYGIEDEEKELYSRLSNNPSIILYPGHNSKPISEMKEWYLNQTSPIHICVIDSTWPQSHAMANSLPDHIPRVKIDELIFAPSQFLNRKQSKNKSKVSTIEAVIMALRGIGETDEALYPFEKSLQYSVDTVLKQCGKSPVYGNNIQPKIPEGKVITKGPYNSPQVNKPKRCLCCNAPGETTNFKNHGVRNRKEDEEADISYLTIHIPEENRPEAIEVVKAKKFRIWKCHTCDQYFPGIM